MRHTSDICVLCMVTFCDLILTLNRAYYQRLTQSMPCPIYFRSIRSKFWPKTDKFEVSTSRNLKAPILTFDLTLTWHVTWFWKFRRCFRIVSSRAFERRVARLSTAIRSRVMTWGRLTPPSKSRVAKYPSNCRVKGNSPLSKKCCHWFWHYSFSLYYQKQTLAVIILLHSFVMISFIKTINRTTQLHQPANHVRLFWTSANHWRNG